MAAFDRARGAVVDAWSSVVDTVRDSNVPAPALVGGALVAVLGGYWLTASSSAGYKKKPTSAELSGGGIDAKRVKSEFDNYSASYGTAAGEGILEREKTSELVDTFYNLVTDIYEWGWGQSFHFSPLLPGKDERASEAAHEARLAALLRLKPGQRCIDVGCGVGGPMRTIAAVSGARVTGVTINSYQVGRAQYHNEKVGLAGLCEAVQADFLKLPFEEGTFDGAYAIEATCHAAKLEDVYSQVFKVLKPGAHFCSYEWVSTKEYNPHNPEHVKIIDEINYGNGLPEMRTWKQAEDAGKAVGFELVSSYDIATQCAPCGPWYGRLKFSRLQHHVNHAIVSVMCFLRIAPKGVADVHKMLVDVADSLVRGGETGVFSPMHLLVFRKPTPKAGAGAKAAAH